MWKLKRIAFLSACGKRRSSVRARTRIGKFLLVSLCLWWKRFPRLVLRWLSLLGAIPKDLVFGSGEACSLEMVDNIPMEELFRGSQCDGSATGSSVAL